MRAARLVCRAAALAFLSLARPGAARVSSLRRRVFFTLWLASLLVLLVVVSAAQGARRLCAGADDSVALSDRLQDCRQARFGARAVAIARRYLGIPYRLGGTSPSTGFDCSGFVAYVFAQIGVNLPHYAAAQYGYGSPIEQAQLEPGDLVFFASLSHVGIYIGGGQFVHAPRSGKVVKISNLSDSWYAATYAGARRP